MVMIIKKGVARKGSLFFFDREIQDSCVRYVILKNRNLREGVTTGTCATAAAMASALWQRTGNCPDMAAVDTPSGKTVYLHIIKKAYPVCGVIKDAGDDPDVTHGCEICAQVEIGTDDGALTFIGGKGVGVITVPGLKLPVGEPAINPVPRQMIETHVRKVIGSLRAKVTVSVPEGEALASRTFNPRLGIKGGISILGTSGIVRPMSEDALKESLSVELGVRLAESKNIALVPGNAGEEALHRHFDGDIACVQMSNYVGYMLDEALNMGAQSVLIAGFAGKLVKIAADIMNTHSHVADGRRETVCTYAALEGASVDIIQELFQCKTAQGTIDVLKKYNLSYLWSKIAEAGCEKCRLRTGGRLAAGMIIFDKDLNIIGVSDQAEDILDRMGLSYPDLDRIRKRTEDV